MAVRLDERARLETECSRFPRPPGPLRGIIEMHQMTRVLLQSDELQVAAASDDPHQFQRRFTERDASTAHAWIEIDENAQADPRRPGHFIEHARPPGVIDHHPDRRAGRRQRHHPRHLVDTGHR